MANNKAIQTTKNGLTIAIVALGDRRGVAGSVRQEVHDGDTIAVRTAGNFGVRFLGVDAPEISFQLPGSPTFTGIADPKFIKFLTDPFAAAYPPFDPPLHPKLKAHLRKGIGKDSALNHHRHALVAEQALEAEVLADLKTLKKSEVDFRFFLAFATEVVDRYGRLLGYIHPDQPQATKANRLPSYQERLLVDAIVRPYFIWPNVNPYRKQTSLKAAVPKPGQAKREADAEQTFRDARLKVARARRDQKGTYIKGDSLKLEPFEVRYLSRTSTKGTKLFRRPPDRWVIDLSSAGTTLIHPQHYHTVPNPEDRLFVPDDYTDLFVKAGWTLGKL